jgi:hypothetical protein
MYNPLPSPTNTPPSLSAGSFACSNDSDGEDGLVYVGEGRDRVCSMCRSCTHIDDSFRLRYPIVIFVTCLSKLQSFRSIIGVEARPREVSVTYRERVPRSSSAFTPSTTFPIWHHVHIGTQRTEMVHSLYTSSYSP